MMMQRRQAQDPTVQIQSNHGLQMTNVNHFYNCNIMLPNGMQKPNLMDNQYNGFFMGHMQQN